MSEELSETTPTDFIETEPVGGFKVGDRVLNPAHNWSGRIKKFSQEPSTGRLTAIVDVKGNDVEEYLGSLTNLSN